MNIHTHENAMAHEALAQIKLMASLGSRVFGAVLLFRSSPLIEKIARAIILFCFGKLMQQLLSLQIMLGSNIITTAFLIFMEFV